MRTSCIEGVAIHGDLGSCAGVREDAGEALTEGDAGRVIEPRNHQSGVPTPSQWPEGNIAGRVSASCQRTPRGQRACACVESSGARTGRSRGCPSGCDGRAGRSGNAKQSEINNSGLPSACRLLPGRDGRFVRFWPDRVVPVRVELVAADRQGFDLLFGVGQAGGVFAGVQLGGDGQPGGRGGGGDQLDDGLVAGQRPAAPVAGDLREQPVLDFVPLGGAGPMPLLVGGELSFGDR